MTISKKLGLAFLASLACIALYVVWKKAPDESTTKTEPTLTEKRTPRTGLTKHAKPNIHSLKKASFAGTLRDAKGAAIAAAHICAFASSDTLSMQDTLTPNCTLSKADGRYSFTALVPAHYSVSASKVGFAPGHYEFDDEDGTEKHGLFLAEGESRDEVDIILNTGGAQLTGIVQDIGGGPIGGAWVVIGSGSWTQRGQVTVQTKEDGRFSAWVMEGRISGSASAEGYSDGDARGFAPGVYMEILMTPESVLAGIVVEAGTGQPVADALVRAGPTEGWGGGNSSRTDSEGRFRIPRLDPGRYKPDAEIRGAYGQLAASVLLGLGETANEIRIEMHVAYIVRGQVLIEGTDTPCKGGGISIDEKGGSNRGWGKMDKDTQHLEFESVQPGRYTASVYCNGYVSKEEYPDLVVENEDQEGLRWYVEVGESIAGTVKSSSGQAISDADVVARKTGGGSNWMRSSARATSNDDGSFLIEGVSLGEYEVSASADDQLAAAEGLRVTVKSGEIPTVDLVFVESSSIRGTLVDQDGEPVAKASIFARGLDTVGRGRTQVLDDGSFELETMRPGRYNVRATGAMRAPGKGDDDVRGKNVEVKIGEVAEVHLIVETQSGVITGQVLDQNGTPVVDAFVESQRESERAGASSGAAKRRVRWSWNSKPALTDMDGNFEIKNLAPGKFTLRAYREGGGEALSEHVAVGDNAVLKIQSTASIAGTVIAGAATLREFTITAFDKTSGVSRSESFFRTRGMWSMTELPAGTYDLTAKASQGTASELGLVVTEGQEKTGVSLTLKERAVVTGRMVDIESNEPIKGLYVSVSLTSSGRGYSFTSSSSPEQTTNEKGEFTVRDAPAGRVQITAFSMDYKNSKYGFFRTIRVLKPSNNNDLGDLQLPRKRINRGEESGDLGFTQKSEEPDTEPEDAEYEVALVRPDGPAANTGLEVGDIIVSIDGHDVRGLNSYLIWSLMSVKPGVTLKLGLARGETIELTTGPPR